MPPLPQYIFMMWCLVKHRDNFTFYLLWKEAVSGLLYVLTQHLPEVWRMHQSGQLVPQTWLKLIMGQICFCRPTCLIKSKMVQVILAELNDKNI